jgi:hypothetical protein
VTGCGRRRRQAVLATVLVAALLAGCAPDEPLTAPVLADLEVPSVDGSEVPEHGPEGELTVGYPSEPTAWIVSEGDDLAALDLAAVWGLPLYRVDDQGLPVRALAADERWSEDGHLLEVALRPGSWTDGAPVTAADVVATARAVRGTGLGSDLELVEEVEVVDERTVRFRFRVPTARWWALPGPVGVLPAHVLDDGGLEAAATLEVSGGNFRLRERMPGLGATFEAHPGSPLGSPATAVLNLRIVPVYDVALGLLAEGELDVAIGHVPLAPVARAEALGLEALAPVGGSWVRLRWRGGDVDAVARRAVAAVVDVAEQVEGLRLGRLLEVPVLDEPPVASPAVAVEEDAVADVSAVISLRTDEEALSVTGRLLEAQLRAREAGVTLRRDRTPDDVVAARQVDGVLEVVRDLPRPDLGIERVPAEVGQALASAVTVGDVEALEALGRAAEDASIVPLYRAAVAHVWRDGVEGIVPSAWPGTGFWNVARWRAGRS